MYILHYLRVDWSIIERAPIWVCIVLSILCCDVMQFSQHTVVFSVLVILAETFNLIFHTQPVKQALILSAKMLKLINLLDKHLSHVMSYFLGLPHFIIQTILSSFTDNHDGNVYNILISSCLLVLFSRLELGVNVVCNLSFCSDKNNQADENCYIVYIQHIIYIFYSMYHPT